MPTAGVGTAAKVEEIKELIPCKLIRETAVAAGAEYEPVEETLKVEEYLADREGGGPGRAEKEVRTGLILSRGEEGLRECMESKLFLASFSSTTRSESKNGGISNASGVRGRAGKTSAAETD